MVSDLTSMMCRMLQHLIVAYPLLFCLLRPTFGLPYLDTFFGSYRCNTDRDDTFAFLLPLWTIAALTAMPVLISAHEAIHEFAASLRKHRYDRFILPFVCDYVCRVVVVAYLFMGTHHGKENYLCSPGVKQLVLMVIGLVLHAVALMRYCTRFRESAKQRCLDIPGHDPKQGQL